MILCGISGIDCSACGRWNSRINRSSGIDRLIANLVLCEPRAPIRKQDVKTGLSRMLLQFYTTG